MRIKLTWASGIAVLATMLTAILSAEGSGAIAQESIPAIVQQQPAPEFISEPVVQALPVESEEAETTPDIQPELENEIDVSSLADLVAAQPHKWVLSRHMQCLAGAIYFESRGESLNGQLAVGRVIIERARSSRFPDSYCGVVFQRSQFSFVRGNRIPKIRKASQAWKKAVAIAQIAANGSWESPVEGALFFHAARVSPGWRLTRIARVDNHVFYR